MSDDVTKDDRCHICKTKLVPEWVEDLREWQFPVFCLACCQLLEREYKMEEEVNVETDTSQGLRP